MLNHFAPDNSNNAGISDDKQASKQQPKASRLYPHAGFTLIELMMVLCITSIVYSLGFPTFRETTRDSRMTAALNNFNGALKLARSQAIKEKTTVVVCASIDQTSCSNSNAWEQGWLVYWTDSSSQQHIVKVGEATETFASLRASHFSDNTRITFLKTGELGDNNNRGTFVLCDERGAGYAKAMIVNAVGKTERAYDQNDNGIVDDDAGVDVTCPR